MAFRSGSVTGKGIVYSRRRGRGFSGRSLVSRGKPSVIYEESEEESDHSLQPARFGTRLQSQQNDIVNANRSALKDKSNVTGAPKRRETVPVSLGSADGATKVRELGGDAIRSAGGTKIQKLFPASGSSIGISDPRVSIGGSNLEVGTLGEQVESTSDSHELPVEQPTLEVYWKKPKSGNSDKCKRDSTRKGSRITSGQAGYSHVRKSATTSGTDPPGREEQVTSLEKSSRPVARIQEQNERAIDESVQEQASAPNTETKIPCQKARLADNEIEDREYDPMPELTNPDERDKVDHRKLQFKDNEPSVRSSPPYSPPKIPIEQCLQTILDLTVSAQPSSTPFRPVNSEEYITPSQSDDPTINKGPPGIRRQVSFWNSPSSRSTQPIYIASPCPATDMRTEDFVMLRRKREISTDEDDLEPARPQPIVRRGGKEKTRVGSRVKDRRTKGKEKAAQGDQGKELESGHQVVAAVEKKKSGSGKWVRFLDVALTCPSDESDELSICKPSWTKKEVAGQTSKQ